ncbi:MAG: hypothetical protein IPH59_10470 [bacterium]|nr:hypothetical protein [bacterium]
MKRQLPLLLVFTSGMLMVVQYFIPAEISDNAYEYLLDWTVIIGIFALALGIWSLIRVSVEKVRRKTPGYGYTYVSLLGLAVMVIIGLNPWGKGLEDYTFSHLFRYTMIPIQSTMFSLLAFFIASAAYRAFRARSVISAVLLIAALVMMFRVIPMGQVSIWINETANWLLLVPNLAAKRAIIIGVGLGMVATALKVVLGIERAYLGKD